MKLYREINQNSTPTEWEEIASGDADEINREMTQSYRSPDHQWKRHKVLDDDGADISETWSEGVTTQVRICGHAARKGRTMSYKDEALEMSRFLSPGAAISWLRHLESHYQRAVDAPLHRTASEAERYYLATGSSLAADLALWRASDRARLSEVREALEALGEAAQ